MAHGGKRPGAGRKNGSATKKKAAVLAEAVRQGITPAEVMQRAMEWHFEAGRYDEAAAVARDLAPYVHPRKSPEHPKDKTGVVVRRVHQLVVVHVTERPGPGGAPGADGRLGGPALLPAQ